MNKADRNDFRGFLAQDVFPDGKQYSIDGMLVEREAWNYLDKNQVAKVTCSVGASIAKENKFIDFIIEFEADKAANRFFIVFKSFDEEKELHRQSIIYKNIFKYEDDIPPKNPLWVIWVERNEVKLPALCIPRVKGAKVNG